MDVPYKYNTKGTTLERNLLIKIAYDGAHFHGWQIQNNAYTVQEAFQTALFKIIGETVDIKACSRTDTGVHARVFCISMKINNPIATHRLMSALNHFLPTSVVVLSCEETAMDFHARYSCKGKEYVYQIHNSKLRDPFLDTRAFHYWYDIDEKLLDKAAAHFVGTHDFTAFCTGDARRNGDMTRTIYSAKVHRDGDMVYFTVSGNGFLYNMVRIMVGTLLKVQEGKIKVDEIPQILQSKDRSKAGTTASPCGLYLNKVFY